MDILLNAEFVLQPVYALSQFLDCLVVCHLNTPGFSKLLV
jgi:hypothetical protein